MEEAIRQAAERHFQGQDCTVNCVAIAQLRGKFAMMMWIMGILLGILCGLEGTNLMLNVATSNSLSGVKAKQDADMKSVSDRLNVHRDQLDTIIQWQLDGRIKK